MGNDLSRELIAGARRVQRSAAGAGAQHGLNEARPKKAFRSGCEEYLREIRSQGRVVAAGLGDEGLALAHGRSPIR